MKFHNMFVHLHSVSMTYSRFLNSEVLISCEYIVISPLNKFFFCFSHDFPKKHPCLIPWDLIFSSKETVRYMGEYNDVVEIKHHLS